VTEKEKKSDDHNSWCSLLLDGVTVTAYVRHVGAGRYRIMEDRSGGKYVGRKVDASDIFHC
jgi:hypothetical protein